MPDARSRVGIMQPYFFPYLGHFALIANVDRWVVFDVTQYTPKTWMNRNRVLHPSQGWMYLTVPLQGSSQHRLIREMMLSDPEAALPSIKGKLAHYRKVAPHYEDVIGVVERGFAGRADDSLVGLDTSCLAAVCEYLSIPFDYTVCSAMGLDLSDVAHAGQWALRVAEQMGATEYLNPMSGAHLFDPAEFAAAGLTLSFVDMPAMDYPTGRWEFVPSLSVLDVLMWNDPEDVSGHIRRSSTVVPAATLDE